MLLKLKYIKKKTHILFILKVYSHTNYCTLDGYFNLCLGILKNAIIYIVFKYVGLSRVTKYIVVVLYKQTVKIFKSFIERKYKKAQNVIPFNFLYLIKKGKKTQTLCEIPNKAH